ncbi:MAG: polymer-forming cytoskeletal protein [Deltaproteobacteria bacterium]|nr:polymer-forming cytoskeletal protein [Deltaproteobacteria bacterium]
MENVTIVSAGVRVSGTITGKGPLAVAGRVDGHVAVEGEVQVGPRARVEAEVNADLVAVAGFVKGTVKATTAVALMAGGQVEGTIDCKRVDIDPQARLKGRLVMPLTLPRGIKGAPTSSDNGGW